jgi:hypothetical protein
VSSFLDEQILWEDDGFIIITDHYIDPGREGLPTATLWHRCRDKTDDASVICRPQEYPWCSGCHLHVPAELVGFWELVRYGQEQG